MKNNKFLKIASLILSCLLLIGAVVGISVSADDAPTAEIKFMNLAYESAPQLVYYVDSANVAEDETVKVLLWNDAPAAVALEGAAVAESAGTLNVSDASYLAFLSEEIAPKDLRLNVYAAPVVVDADGAIVYAGKVVKYSVFEYAVTRFGMTPTEDQTALYTALLKFGGAVQEVLFEQGKYTEEDLAKAGGFANEYCGIQIDVSVDGKVTAGEVAYYAEGDSVVLSDDVVVDGKSFQYFADASGAEIAGTHGYPTYSTVATVPGKTVFTSVFVENNAKLSTFDEGSTFKGNNITLASNAPETETILSKAYGDYTIKYVAAGKSTIVDGTYLHSRHARVVSILDKDGAEVNATEDNVYTVGMKFNKNDGGTAIGALNAGSSFDVTNSVADSSKFNKVIRSVFQFDIYVSSANGESQGWFVNSNNHKIWGYNIGVNGGALRIRIQGDSNNTNCADHGLVIKSGLALNSWHTVRFEYYDLADDAMAVYVYVNGEFCPSTHEGGAWIHKWNEVNPSYTEKNKNDAHFPKFTTNYLYSSTQMDIYYDNMYLVTEYEYVDPTGLHRNDPATVDFDYTEELAAAGKTMADVYTHDKTAKFLGFAIAQTPFGKQPGNGVTYQYFAEENGNYYLKSGTQGAYSSVNTTKMLDEAVAPATITVEFDLRYYGFGELNEQKTGGNNNFGWIRFYDCTSVATGDKMDKHINLALTISDTGYTSNVVNIAGVDIAKGKWVNIRIEASPKAGDTNKMDYKFFLDNICVKEGTYSVTGEAFGVATTSTFGGMVFQSRTHFNYYEYDLDNLYVGVTTND